MKLSDTQLVILAAAAQHKDHALVLSPDLESSVAGKLVEKLIRANLIEEIEAAGLLPVWRRAEDGAFALRITDAGLKAIGVDDSGASSTPAADKSGPEPRRKRRGSKKGDPGTRKPKAVNSRRSKTRKAGRKPAGKSGSAKSGGSSASRSGTKLDEVTGLLSRKRGATIQEMMDVTGWLPHTTRAVLSGLRKRGMKIEREADADKPTVYRIVGRDSRVRSTKRSGDAA